MGLGQRTAQGLSDKDGSFSAGCCEAAGIQPMNTTLTWI
jgi:hypothetical protein